MASTVRLQRGYNGARNRVQYPGTPPAGARRAVAPRKLSRLHQPDEMSLEAWQTALRRQFGREQQFLLKNIGGQPVFSEFEVTNPQSRSTYRVAIRGSEPGNNFCSCPDFATNTLGTCKHIEFTLARLLRSRAVRRALAQGSALPFSEVYLHYGAQRQVRGRPAPARRRRSPVWWRSASTATARSGRRHLPGS